VVGDDASRQKLGVSQILVYIVVGIADEQPKGE
jgi:hypothetical protein